MAIRRPDRTARVHDGNAERGGLSTLAVSLALIGFVCCTAVLLFLRFAHWAGAHPLAGTALILLSVPVFYVLLRAMPRTRELRRAARAGMAQADREMAVATMPVHDGLTVELPAPDEDLSMRHDPFRGQSKRHGRTRRARQRGGVG